MLHDGNKDGFMVKEPEKPRQVIPDAYKEEMRTWIANHPYAVYIPKKEDGIHTTTVIMKDLQSKPIYFKIFHLYL